MCYKNLWRHHQRRFPIAYALMLYAELSLDCIISMPITQDSTFIQTHTGIVFMGIVIFRPSLSFYFSIYFRILCPVNNVCHS
jgi:hypothetical protein